MLDLVSIVRAAVSLPLAVKIGPGFSAPANLCRRLVEAGADGLVLFNRYLRPDVDLEKLELVPSLLLSDSYDSRIPLQWIGILRGRLPASLAASSGVHTFADALKLLLVGADVVMTTSALQVLRRLVKKIEDLGYAVQVQPWPLPHPCSVPISDTITWAIRSLTPGMVFSKATWERKGSRPRPTSASRLTMAASRWPICSRCRRRR